MPSFNIIIWFRDASRTRCTISQCPERADKSRGRLPTQKQERRLAAQPPDVRRHYHCSQRVPHLYQFKKCATLLRQPLDYIFIWFLARCFTMSPVKVASQSPPRSSTVPIAVSQLNSVSISKCFICAVCLAHSIYIKSNQKPCTLTGSVSSNFQHVFAYAYVPPSDCTYPTVHRTLHPQYSPKSILNNSTVCLSHQLATLYAILFDFPLSPCSACDEPKQSRQVMPGQYYVLSNIFTLLS